MSPTANEGRTPTRSSAPASPFARLAENLRSGGASDFGEAALGARAANDLAPLSGSEPPPPSEPDNPERFARLYYHTTSQPGFLYRSPASHDPVNHYPIVTHDDREGIVANVLAGQRPIEINPAVDVERLSPPHLWAYLEALRSWQHEGVVPDPTNPAVAPIWYLLAADVERRASADAAAAAARRALLDAAADEQTPERILAQLEKIWAANRGPGPRDQGAQER